MFSKSTLSLLFTLAAIPAIAQEPTPAPQLDEIVVRGRADDLLRIATSASEGSVGHRELEARPLSRRGELLEVVPGMVVTQHSGDGKANQYFLRGFNLDHGTDFAITVDGLPVNMPTHGHGQGYADINFVIPELVERVDFEKGPFYPEVGNFSGAGAAQFRLFDTLPGGLSLASVGSYGYARALVADSPKLGPGTLLYAFEYTHSDGPWDHASDSGRFNALLRYVWGAGDDRFRITAMSYHADWNSTDQIPERLVESGKLSRFGSLNPSDGGASDRHSLSFDWTRDEGERLTTLNLYGIYYRLNLFSDFTYLLDDPGRGDQFEQADTRFVLGGALARLWNVDWCGLDMENSLGLQFRDDIIPEVALKRSENRRVVSEIRRDRVNEFTVGLYGKSKVRWSDWFRTEAGLRGDLYHFNVASSIPGNSGEDTAAILSPKLSFIFGPWKQTELYLNLGTGFHSNDARGIVTGVDPLSGEPATKASPLVRTKGAEIGIRTAGFPGLVSTLSFWALESDSELVFTGDSGGTEAAGATRRYGIEWANYYKPLPWLCFDADLALTHARFVDADETGSRIPNSIAAVFTVGATVEMPCGLFGSVRYRYFGPQPLVEDNSVRTTSSSLVNARIGYRRGNWEAALDVLNLFDRKVNDITYYYASRVGGEPAEGVEDLHFHPAEPRSLRLTLTYRF